MRLIHFNKSLLIIAAIISFGIASHALFISLKEKETITNEMKAKIITEARNATKNIQNYLMHIKEISQTLASQINSDDISFEEMPKTLKKFTEDNPEILGIGAAFAPYTYKKDLRLYAPYYYKNPKGVFTLSQIEDFYDYTKPSTDPFSLWYTESLKKNMPQWSDPYYGTVSHVFILPYSLPFYKKGQKEPSGVILVTYTLSYFNSLLSTLNLRSMGYAYLLSENGNIISFPETSYIGKPAKEVWENPLITNTLDETPIFHETKDPLSSDKDWVIQIQVKISPTESWTLGFEIDKKHVLQTIWSAKKVATIVGFYLLSLFFFLTLFFGLHTGSKKALDLSAFSFSILSLVLIITLWVLTMQKNLNTPGFVPMTEAIRYNNFLEPYIDRVKRIQKTEPFLIPTGINIETIDFSTSDTLRLSGYLWQKYPKNYPLKKEPFFPLGSYRDVLKQAYEEEGENYDLIGWFFITEQLQNFSDSRYPLDCRNINIQIRPKNFIDPIIYVPDLASYRFLTPTKLPGLEKNLLLKGWTPFFSFFSYLLPQFQTNFGLYSITETQSFPELTFQIGLQRDLSTALFGHLPVMIIVAVFLFLTMLISMVKKDIIFPLSIGTFFIFTLIISQLRIREVTEASVLTYFEYFYFALLLMTFLVTANNLLYIHNYPNRFILSHNNFYPKILFWPLLLSIVLGISLIMLL